jgi:hypothetical protein
MQLKIKWVEIYKPTLISPHITRQTSPWVTNLRSYHNAWLSLILKRKYTEQIKLSLSLGDCPHMPLQTSPWSRGDLQVRVTSCMRC